MHQDAVTAGDLFRVLWRRKLILLLSGLLAGALALGIAASRPASFVGEGLLLVGGREPQIPELSVLAAPATADQNRSELDVLRSHALIEAVARQLDLADDPAMFRGSISSRLEHGFAAMMRGAGNAIGGAVGARLAALFPPPAPSTPAERTEDAVDLVRRHLDIGSEKDSGVVTVRFTAPSPLLAAAVINTLFDRYIADELAARRYVMQQTHRWLAERAAALLPEVEAADRAVQQFRSTHPTFEVAQGSLTALDLNNTETALATAREELLRRQTALAAARGTGFREALQSPMLQDLRNREADARQRMAFIGRRLGTRHPDYIAAANTLAETESEIQAASGKVAAAMKQDVTEAARRVGDLESRVAASRQLAETSTGVALRLAELTRDADTRRRVYETFMTRAAETEPTSAEFPTARVVSPAVPPDKPDRLPLAVVWGFGTLAGVLAAAAGCIGGFLARQGIESAHELESVTDLPCLGALPLLRRRRGGAPLLLDDRSDGAVETLRAMRFAMQTRLPLRDDGAPVVLVTSSEIGDGKTMLAASFARLCAADGQRVLLVEADLRRPHLAQTLGLAPARSLEPTLAGRLPFADAVTVDPDSGLHCLAALGRAVNPQKLLRSGGFAALLERARRDYDLVVIDSPPVLRVADPLLIAGLCDVILFAVRWDRTPSTLVAEGLRRIPVHLRERVATVLTQVPADRLGRTDYYAGYQPAPLPRTLPGTLSGTRVLTLLPPWRKAMAGKILDGEGEELS